MSILRPVLNVCDFRSLGPDHMNVYVAVKDDGKIREISLLPSNVTKDIKWDKWMGMEVVFIKYTYGRDVTPLNFYVDIVTNKSIDVPSLEIVLSGQYMHDFENTYNFDRFINKFPKWADVTSGLATYDYWLL